VEGEWLKREIRRGGRGREKEGTGKDPLVLAHTHPDK